MEWNVPCLVVLAEMEILDKQQHDLSSYCYSAVLLPCIVPLSVDSNKGHLSFDLLIFKSPIPIARNGLSKYLPTLKIL